MFYEVYNILRNKIHENNRIKMDIIDEINTRYNMEGLTILYAGN